MDRKDFAFTAGDRSLEQPRVSFTTLVLLPVTEAEINTSAAWK
jgi:hypothetical protein